MLRAAEEGEKAPGSSADVARGKIPSRPQRWLAIGCSLSMEQDVPPGPAGCSRLPGHGELSDPAAPSPWSHPRGCPERPNAPGLTDLGARILPAPGRAPPGAPERWQPWQHLLLLPGGCGRRAPQCCSGRQSLGAASALLLERPLRGTPAAPQDLAAGCPGAAAGQLWQQDAGQVLPAPWPGALWQ